MPVPVPSELLAVQKSPTVEGAAVIRTRRMLYEDVLLPLIYKSSSVIIIFIMCATFHFNYIASHHPVGEEGENAGVELVVIKQLVHWKINGFWKVVC